MGERNEKRNLLLEKIAGLRDALHLHGDYTELGRRRRKRLYDLTRVYFAYAGNGEKGRDEDRGDGDKNVFTKLSNRDDGLQRRSG
jgi:hypothetical protein